MRVFRVGLPGGVEPREPSRAVLGDDIHGIVAEPLLQFLRQLQIAGAEHHLGAEVVENVRRAMLAIQFPQLGLVLHHEGEAHAVAAHELGCVGQTIDAAKPGKFVQQHESLHAHVAVLLRRLDRVEIDELVKEQAEQGRHARYVARRNRHVDRHGLDGAGPGRRNRWTRWPTRSWDCARPAGGW